MFLNFKEQLKEGYPNLNETSAGAIIMKFVSTMAYFALPLLKFSARSLTWFQLCGAFFFLRERGGVFIGVTNAFVLLGEVKSTTTVKFECYLIIVNSKQCTCSTTQ